MPLHPTVQHIFENEVEKAKVVLKEFQEALAKRPLEAFGWVNAPVEAAARIFVYESVLDATGSEVGRTQAGIIQFATERVQHLSSRGYPHSTNPLDPARQAEELRAWSKVVEYCQYGLEA